MGCLFAIFDGLFPRAADIIFWLARPTVFLAPFGGSWFWAVLGIIFLPFTTLIYLFLWAPGGIHGFDWFWIGLAALLDLGHWAASATQRNQIPGRQARPA
jgi:hypothetical protein